MTLIGLILDEESGKYQETFINVGIVNNLFEVV